MNLSDVMGELAEALGEIDGLNVFAYWADHITPPAAEVGLPESYVFDATGGRGSDELRVVVAVHVARVDMASAVDSLAAYADGSGAASVKAAIEAHDGSSAYDTARVESIEFVDSVIGSGEYLTARFQVHITGSGAS